jgi:hypothetical protein
MWAIGGLRSGYGELHPPNGQLISLAGKQEHTEPHADKPDLRQLCPICSVGRHAAWLFLYFSRTLPCCTM